MPRALRALGEAFGQRRRDVDRGADDRVEAQPRARGDAGIERGGGIGRGGLHRDGADLGFGLERPGAGGEAAIADGSSTSWVLLQADTAIAASNDAARNGSRLMPSDLRLRNTLPEHPTETLSDA